MAVFDLKSLLTPKSNPRKKRKKRKLPHRRADGRFKATPGMPKKNPRRKRRKAKR
jgi:hypothetical protein